VRGAYVKAAIGILAAAIVATSACAPGPVRVSVPSAMGRPKMVVLRVQVKDGKALVVRDVPLEYYVAATAASEVHPDSADEAVAERMYEVQAVIARTYALTNRGRHAKEGFDLCSRTHCQLYEPARLNTSRWSSVVQTATERTAGEVLWFDAAPARAVFHADCGGHTSAAAAVWGGLAPPYLTAKKDAVSSVSAHAEWTFESRAEALRIALNADPRTAVGDTLADIEVAGRDAAGRAEKLILRGTRTFVIRGEVFRDVVTRRLGVRTLKSTLFSVKKSRGAFTFTGRGFGHGVGLCQAGALARLKAGDSPEDVLSFYFPGASVRRS
jgi:stage II sporulation protein D